MLAAEVVIPDEVVALAMSDSVVARSGMRDAEYVPKMQRPSHWTISDDRRRVTCFFQKHFETSIRRCLESNSQIAFNVANGISHECYQIKGEVVETRAMTQAEGVEAQARVDGLKPMLDMFGIGDDARARIWGPPSLAVTLEAREVFVQTPGPSAGRRIAPPEE